VAAAQQVRVALRQHTMQEQTVVVVVVEHIIQMHIEVATAALALS
jgi:hypothetical protein